MKIYCVYILANKRNGTRRDEALPRLYKRNIKKIKNYYIRKEASKKGAPLLD